MLHFAGVGLVSPEACWLAVIVAIVALLMLTAPRRRRETDAARPADLARRRLGL